MFQENYKIDDHVEVTATPGHTGSDVSVVVRQTANGTTVVAGEANVRRHHGNVPFLEANKGMVNAQTEYF